MPVNSGFSGLPFNPMYFLSVLAVHKLYSQRFCVSYDENTKYILLVINYCFIESSNTILWPNAASRWKKLKFGDHYFINISMIYEQLGTTGIKLSKLSLGGAAFGGVHCYGDYNANNAERTIVEAIRKGINYIDVAPHYGLGQAEEFLGKVLKHIPRESYYISTKVGRFGSNFNFTANSIIEGFEQSLKRLNLQKVDIVIVHDVEFADSIDLILNETLPTVENLVKSQKAKFIGISGYPLETLLDIVTRSHVKIECVLTYARDTLIDNTLQDYIPKFKEKGIGLINAGCVGMRLLTNEGPTSWHPAAVEIKELCQSAADFCKKNEVELGQLALYHSLNQPGCCTCLVGMNDINTLHTNLNIMENGLDERKIKILQEVREKFFRPEQRYHWEGAEIELYKKKKL